MTSNTLIDNGRQISGLGNAAPGGILADNVLLSVSAGTSDVDSSKLSGMTARNNYFSQGDPGGALRHAGNRYDGSALSQKKDWRKINSIDDVDWDDLERMARSSTIRSENERQPVNGERAGSSERSGQAADQN